MQLKENILHIFHFNDMGTQQTMSKRPYSYFFKNIYDSYDAVLLRRPFTGSISI